MGCRIRPDRGAALPSLRLTPSPRGPRPSRSPQTASSEASTKPLVEGRLPRSSPPSRWRRSTAPASPSGRRSTFPLQDGRTARAGARGKPGSARTGPSPARRHALAVPHPERRVRPRRRDEAGTGDPGAQAGPAGVAGSSRARRRGVLSARPGDPRRLDHPPGAESPPPVPRLSRPSLPGGVPVGGPAARLGLSRHPGGVRPDDLSARTSGTSSGAGPGRAVRPARRCCVSPSCRPVRPNRRPASGCRRRSSGSSPTTSPVRSWAWVSFSSFSGKTVAPCTTSSPGRGSSERPRPGSPRFEESAKGGRDEGGLRACRPPLLPERREARARGREEGLVAASFEDVTVAEGRRLDEVELAGARASSPLRPDESRGLVESPRGEGGEGPGEAHGGRRRDERRLRRARNRHRRRSRARGGDGCGNRRDGTGRRKRGSAKEEGRVAASTRGAGGSRRAASRRSSSAMRRVRSSVSLRFGKLPPEAEERRCDRARASSPVSMRATPSQ